MEAIIIWFAMNFFTEKNHDYPMPSKSTVPITAYYDPSVKLTFELRENLDLELESDLHHWGNAQLVFKF